MLLLACNVKRQRPRQALGSAPEPARSGTTSCCWPPELRAHCPPVLLLLALLLVLVPVQLAQLVQLQLTLSWQVGSSTLHRQGLGGRGGLAGNGSGIQYSTRLAHGGVLAATLPSVSCQQPSCN